MLRNFLVTKNVILKRFQELEIDVKFKNWFLNFAPCKLLRMLKLQE